MLPYRTFPSPKGEGFTDPLVGTLNDTRDAALMDERRPFTRQSPIHQESILFSPSSVSSVPSVPPCWVETRYAQDAIAVGTLCPRSARNAASTFPVWDCFAVATCSGMPCATTCPPPSPPSGPRSMIQSASAITSRLCSMTTTVLPASTNRCSTRISFSTSAICKPTVGSSSTYSVFLPPAPAPRFGKSCVVLTFYNSL